MYKTKQEQSLKQVNNNHEFLIIVLANFRPQQTIQATLKFMIFKALKTKQESKIWPNPDTPKKINFYLNIIIFRLILFLIAYFYLKIPNFDYFSMFSKSSGHATSTLST